MNEAYAVCYLWVGNSLDNLVLHPSRGVWWVSMEGVDNDPESEWLDIIASVIYDELPIAARIDVFFPNGERNSIYFQR